MVNYICGAEMVKIIQDVISEAGPSVKEEQSVM